MKNIWLKIKTNWGKTLFAFLSVSVAYAAVISIPESNRGAGSEVLDFKNWTDPDTKTQMVTYSFKGEEYVPNTGDIISESSLIRKNGDVFVGEFYSGNRFIKQNNKWYYREHRIIPKIQFDAEFPVSFLERYGVQEVYAQTEFTSAVDGFVSFDGVDSGGISWATVRSNSGNQVAAGAATFRAGYGEAEGANTFDFNRRGALAFLTGDDIAAGSTIVSCTLSLTPNTIADGLANSPDYLMANSTGSFTTSLADSDYQTHGNTELSDRIDTGSFALETPEIFTCTADGRTNVGTGAGAYTRFMIKTHFDLADSPVPNTNNPGVQQNDHIFFYAIEHTNPTLEPIFTVTFTAGGVGEDESSIIELMYWKLYDFKVALYYGLSDLVSIAYAVTQ